MDNLQAWEVTFDGNSVDIVRYRKGMTALEVRNNLVEQGYPSQIKVFPV